jgi:serine/threonine protein phosphatase 1
MVPFKSLPSLGKPRRNERRAKVPKGVKLYVIGDIHGRADLLKRLFARIDAVAAEPPQQAVHVFLGDYIDRGPSSRQVIDLLIARSRFYPTVYLKGNHESYLLEFLRNPLVIADWQLFGGLDTLISYGLAPAMNASNDKLAELAVELNLSLPVSHRRFMSRLRPAFTCGDYFFVHAGVRPGVPLARQCEEDLLWIREDFLLHEETFEKIIVHGHTPVLKPDVRHNRINIDTGAYATGKLTCLVLERDRMGFI